MDRTSHTLTEDDHTPHPVIKTITIIIDTTIRRTKAPIGNHLRHNRRNSKDIHNLPTRTSTGR